MSVLSYDFAAFSDSEESDGGGDMNELTALHDSSLSDGGEAAGEEEEEAYDSALPSFATPPRRPGADAKLSHFTASLSSSNAPLASPLLPATSTFAIPMPRQALPFLQKSQLAALTQEGGVAYPPPNVLLNGGAAAMEEEDIEALRQQLAATRRERYGLSSLATSCPPALHPFYHLCFPPSFLPSPSFAALPTAAVYFVCSLRLCHCHCDIGNSMYVSCPLLQRQRLVSCPSRVPAASTGVH